MLGAVPAVREDIPDLDAWRLPAGRNVGLVLYEDAPRRELSDEGPSITIRPAAIKLSALKRHVPCSCFALSILQRSAFARASQPLSHFKPMGWMAPHGV